MNSNDFQHVLIIGGTGMLSGVVNYYLDNYNQLTLIARNEQRLQNLKSKAINAGKVEVLSLDYTQTESAIRETEQTLLKSIPVDAAILWIHNTGKNFKLKLERLLIKMNSRIKIYELLGSTDLKLMNLSSIQDQPVNSHFRKIILGCIMDNNSRRWLSHEEICRGTLTAIVEDKPVHVVGDLPE